MRADIQKKCRESKNRNQLKEEMYIPENKPKEQKEQENDNIENNMYKNLI